MAYSRRTVTDGVTIMNKDLYDNLQDGIDEAKAAIDSINGVNINTVLIADVEDTDSTE